MIYSNFDFSVLNDPEYKEDSVREDIVAPLLKSLGYASAGKNRIIRSRSLSHPYVMIGSKRQRLTIIPDYLLEVNGKLRFVLDAKAPDREIVKGDNVAQVYSYSIHPEIRVSTYGLCNGRQLALFSIFKHSPERVYDLTNLTKNDLLDMAQKLAPASIGNNEVLDYELDAGLFLYMHGQRSDSIMIFMDIPIPMLGMMSTESFTFSVATTSMTDRPLLMTFDFNPDQLEDLLNLVESETRKQITEALSKQPFVYRNENSPPLVSVKCRLDDKFSISQKGEEFLPFMVDEFFNYRKGSNNSLRRLF